MPAVKIEAFLALEESLTQRLSSTFNALVERLLPAVQDALDEEDFDKAEELVLQLDIEPVYTLNEPYIEYLSHLAMLFGASRLLKNASSGRVGLGFEKEMVEAMMQSFRTTIVTHGERSIVQSALQLIALRRAPPSEQGSYLGTVATKIVAKADKPSMVLPFATFMQGSAKSFFNISSSLHTSRLSALGYTAEANALGVTRYVINEQLDGRTCPVCAFMHGKTFEVEDARGLLSVVLRTQDPAQLKMLQPWPDQSKAGMAFLKGLNREQLVQNGWHVPPFHPRCRGLLDAAGKVPPLKKTQAVDEAQQEGYTATSADFEQMGLKLTQKQIDLWNQTISANPAQVVAGLTGQPLESMLEAMATADDPQSVIGLKGFAVTQAAINIELETPVHGSSTAVKQDLFFRKDKALFVGSVELAKKDSKLFPKIMKSLFGTAKSSGMERMVATTGAESSGYAFAKYGFSMGPTQWKSLKNQIKANLGKGNIQQMMSDTDLKAVNAILASDDPKMVFALADIAHVGKALLSGTNWVGSLDFDDVEAMKRFYAHFS